jgi:hypothetical protein
VEKFLNDTVLFVTKQTIAQLKTEEAEFSKPSQTDGAHQR